MPIIKEESGPDLTIIKRELQQYVSLKDESSAIEDRISSIKKRLTSYADELGEPNEKGSMVFHVNDETSGVKAVVKQRRVSKVFNESVADSLLKERGIFEQCTKTVTVLDEDAVMSAYYNGTLTDKDIEAMFPEKVTWALVLEK